MLSTDLLAWYDQNQRAFPWRARPGVQPIPYHVWLSEVMLQQTTTTTVVPYFLNFLRKWPTILDLSQADLDEILHGWQGLGYYSRARSLHKAAQILAESFPADETQLLKIPGIGPYTAAAIAAIAYDQPTTPVDGNIARIFARLHQIEASKPRLYDLVRTLLKKEVPDQRNSDFIQALMDVGATICLPKKPRCELCPIQAYCQSYVHGTQDLYPKLPPQKERPTRYGIAFWIENNCGQVLIHKRPEKGLLGGMMGFPTTHWTEKPLESPPLTLGRVEHTFTHFHLVLDVCPGEHQTEALCHSVWVKPEELRDYALPTLMKKVAKAALGGHTRK